MADLKIYWGCDSADHAGPSDCFRPMASRWFTLRFKRKAILEIWPDPLESPAMADDLDPAATTAEGNANGEPRTRDNREDLFRSRPPAPAESERDKNALASDLASGIFAGIANKRWGEAQQKREPVLVKAESVARERWMHSDDDHAKMTRWLQNEYSPDENTLPFMDDKLTKHLRERMAKVAREIGKPVRGEKQSHG